ncbi:MAG: c-type cytochrome, partial [Rhodothermales bacterium]|nr:c-type cytochrome [Rhodothermales bacterium]
MRRRLLVTTLVVGGIALSARERPIAEPALHSTSGHPGQSLDATELIAELGCAACHAGVSDASIVGQRAPRLSDAGLRYRPAYVFDFLQNPTRIRRHIGRSRMPGFHLDEAESVALALHLETRTQERAPDIPDPAGERDNPQNGERLIGELGCTGCHTLRGEGAGTALELTDVGKRLQGPWLRRFLTDPTAYDSATPMPA